MKSIKNISKFARDNKIPRQRVQYRIKAGWKFGILNGKLVMYNPNGVQVVTVDDSY